MPTDERVKTPIANVSLAFFICLTFALSWSAWWLAGRLANLNVDANVGAAHFRLSLGAVFKWVGVFVPGIVTLFLILRSGGRHALADFLRTSLFLSSTLQPCCIALVIALSSSLPILLLYRPGIHATGLGLRFVLNTSVNLPLAPLWEELGWRGLLFPKVQCRLSTGWACLIVGLIWGTWHIPLRSSSAPPHAPYVVYLLSFLGYVCGGSFVLGWLYNRASCALLPCIAFHSAINALSTIIDEPVMRAAGIAPLLISTAVLSMFALALHLFWPRSSSEAARGAPLNH